MTNVRTPPLEVRTPITPRPSRKALVVALMNDYEVVLAGLAVMLEPFADRVTVRQLEPGRMAEDPCDVVLYDTFGQDVELGAVIAACNALRLVVYTWHGDPDSVQAALDAGASGYLAKGLSAGVVVDALERVAAGETVVATGARATPRSASGGWPGSVYHLSPRESEIVAWIAQGLTNGEIAARSGLSINTVKTYVRNSYRTIGVTSRSQAVLWALERGFDTKGARDDRW